MQQVWGGGQDRAMPAVALRIRVQNAHAHTNRFGTGPGVEGEFLIGMESGAQQGAALVQQFGVAFT